MSNQPPYYPPTQDTGAPPPGGSFGAAPSPYGAAQNPYGAPGAYGPPVYGHPGAYGNPFVNAANAGKPAMTFFAILAAMPFVWRMVWMAVPRRESPAKLINAAQSGLDGILGLVATILFLVWIYRLTTAIRATQGTSAYSPGMAVGAWFIPLANFVLPFLTVRDAWKRTMAGDARGWIVSLWWATWLAGVGFSILFALLPLMPELNHAIGTGRAALGYAWSATKISTWLSLLLTVRWITERTVPNA